MIGDVVQKMIPKEINSNPVRHVADVDPPLFPCGYPGDGNLERTAHFIISVSEEDDADDRRYWVFCVGQTGRIMAGEMCYTLEAALEFPLSEFDLATLDWREINSEESN